MNTNLFCDYCGPLVHLCGSTVYCIAAHFILDLSLSFCLLLVCFVFVYCISNRVCSLFLLSVPPVLVLCESGPVVIVKTLIIKYGLYVNSFATPIFSAKIPVNWI